MSLETVTAGSLSQTVLQLLDKDKPRSLRAKMFMHLIMDNSFEPEAIETLMKEFLKQVDQSAPGAEAAAMKQELEAAIEELTKGPPRPATFLAEAKIDMPGPKPRVHVVGMDGQSYYPFLREGIELSDLHPGATVLLDPKRAIVLGVCHSQPDWGHEAVFLRQLPGGHIEIQHQEQRLVVVPSQKLRDAIRSGEVKRSDRILWCPHRMVAFDYVPAEEDRSYRFVDQSRIPEVIASRDIGQPHWILGWLVRRTHILLNRPDLLQRFDLRPRVSVFLSGPSGTGKTLTIRAFLHEFYEMLRRLTGNDDIGSRVIRVKSADLLSQWFGVTDKNIDQLFDDIRALASQTFEVDGVPRRLPVVVILEEVESLSRRRGEADGAIYDRVLGMLLQRLDDPVEDIGQLPLIFISTSNRPELVDTAMWRRLGGRHAHFGRLNREGFRAVLSKKLKAHYPYLSNNGTPVEETRARVIDQVVNWLFSPNNDADGLVELTLRDGTKLIKHRRDFLTGAVVEQGVSNCIDHVVFAADETSDPRVGLDASNLIESLTDVIDGLASNLTPQNAADYVDLPEHSAVAHVRHLSGADSGRLFRLAR